MPTKVEHNDKAYKQRLQQLEEGLKNAGVKMTHQRLQICREISASTGHPDAETILHGVRKRVPTISLDTIYRTLWTLLDLGLISTFGIPRERIRFDVNILPHHHFVCSQCGEAYDFHSDELAQLPLPEEVHDFGNVQKTQVEVYGICLKCSEKEDK